MPHIRKEYIENAFILTFFFSTHIATSYRDQNSGESYSSVTAMCLYNPVDSISEWKWDDSVGGQHLELHTCEVYCPEPPTESVPGVVDMTWDQVSWLGSEPSYMCVGIRIFDLPNSQTGDAITMTCKVTGTGNKWYSIIPATADELALDPNAPDTEVIGTIDCLLTCPTDPIIRNWANRTWTDGYITTGATAEYKCENDTALEPLRFKRNDVYETITTTCMTQTIENDDGTTTESHAWLWDDVGELTDEIPPCEVS